MIVINVKPRVIVPRKLVALIKEVIECWLELRRSSPDNVPRHLVGIRTYGFIHISLVFARFGPN